jgi:D-glycero-D-manno-heptose 1,7-bisphosphate phosphatase
MGAFDAVFLDRDGTVNVKPPEGSYVCSPLQLRLLPGAGDAIRALNDAGVLVLVVTNQRGVALMKMSLSDVHQVHEALRERLRRFGARVDGFYICPHADESCGCRKPAPGLLLQASRDHGLRLDRTVMIGDTESDVQAAVAAGARPIRLGSSATQSAASEMFPDLASAVRTLIGPGKQGQGEPPGRRPVSDARVSEKLIVAPT